MRFSYDLSVIVPGVRKDNWIQLYNETCQACKKYSFEFILVGPYAPPQELHDKPNVKYIKDFGTPTRALHLGTLLSEGRYLTWLADDAWVYENSLDQSLDLLLSKNPAKDLIGIRYSEGQNHSGQCPPDAYWTTGYHPDFHLPGIDRNYTVVGVLMMHSDYYREMGGLDVGFIHINMNVHDFSIRAQRNGSTVYLSPTLVMNCDWEPWRTPQNSPLIAAFIANDQPLFKQLYAAGAPPRPIHLDKESWRNTAQVWEKKLL